MKVKKTKRSIKKKTKNRSTPDLLLRLGENIWPLERDICCRPDRMQYLRKAIKVEGCVFCTACGLGPNQASLVLHKTKHSMVVLNRYPYNNGHLLIMPQRHCGDLLALTQEEFQDLNDLLRKSLSALLDSYKCAGFNVGLNLGSVAGAGIPDHLHYHVIPRWGGDTNFFPLIAQTKVIAETLEQTYDRLLPYYS